MVYYQCEVDHKQTYTPLFDREKFLPSPLFVFEKPMLATTSAFPFVQLLLYRDN